MKRSIIVFCIGAIVGGLIAWKILSSSAHEVLVGGILMYQPAPDPKTSGQPPEGYFMESKIYLSAGKSSAVGKQVTATGRISDVKEYEGTGYYPAIINDKIVPVP